MHTAAPDGAFRLRNGALQLRNGALRLRNGGPRCLNNGSRHSWPIGENGSNSHCTFEIIARLQDLLPKVEWQGSASAEERIDLLEGLRRALASDETAEPGAEEEDAAVLLNPWQAVERRNQIFQR